MALLPGSKAPDFTLNSVLDGQEEKVSFLFINFIIETITIVFCPQVNLSQFRGQHLVVMFYPVDFGYVTPTEFYSLAPFLPHLADMNCTLLAISTEHISSQTKSQITPRSLPSSTFHHHKLLWYRSQAGLDLLGVRLASDPVGEVARLYGVYKAEENLAFSAFFLIDPEGYLVAVEKCDFPVSKQAFVSSLLQFKV